MNILILGGTVFVGRHLVNAALERGHNVTLFNRGQHNPHLFPEVERLHGDRDGELAALHRRRWDAVIDTSGYVPRIVRQSAELLAGAVNRYVFISTISVYADTSEHGANEDSPLARLDDESLESVTGETYGGLKVLCEQAVETAVPGRSLIIRPGLIVGPDDPTDRFTYWPHRVSEGGEVLAPLPRDRVVQFIDARDLAEWTVRMIETRQTGVYNATGPDYPLSMEHLLQTCRQVNGSDARLVWVDEQFLVDEGMGEWIELPLWINSMTTPSFYEIDISRAISAGLTFRPLEETVHDTLARDATCPPGVERRAGLTRERERELLTAWATKKD